MPTYEFKCEKCGRVFEVFAPIKKRARLKPTCPRCKSKRVNQRFGRVMVLTASKSESEDFDLGEEGEEGETGAETNEDLE